MRVIGVHVDVKLAPVTRSVFEIARIHNFISSTSTVLCIYHHSGGFTEWCPPTVLEQKRQEGQCFFTHVLVINLT